MKKIITLLAVFFSLGVSAQMTPVGLWHTIDDETNQPKGEVRIVEKEGALVVDMGWAVANLQGAASLETWGAVADRLARTFGRPVVSIYNQDLTIEEQMQAAFRAHGQFLAPSGLHDNPYWIPADLVDGALLDDQLSFMLGRVVPDYADLRARRRVGQMHARGATPSMAMYSSLRRESRSACRLSTLRAPASVNLRSHNFPSIITR